MSGGPSQEWLERSNTETLYHLERQGRTSNGLVPFLGAGISTAFGFKEWRPLLLHAAPLQLVSRIKKQLDKNDYEGAAETLLKELGPDGFQHMVAASAGMPGNVLPNVCGLSRSAVSRDRCNNLVELMV